MSPPSSKSYKEQRHESECEWLARIYRDAKKHGYLTGTPTPLAQEMVSYDEDDNQPAPKSAKARFLLKTRFLNHLALAFGNHGAWVAPTIGLLREDTENNIVTIRLARSNAKGECPHLSDTTRKFAQAFTRTHAALSHGQAFQSNDLEEVVLRLYRSRMLEATSQLRTLWRNNQDKIHDTIAKISGLYDDDGQVDRDEIIGDAIIGLNGSMQAVIGPAVPTDLEVSPENLVNEAHRLFRLEGGLVRERLRNVLGSSLADGIYENIMVLVQPTKSVQTFVRSAQGLGNFRAVEFLRGSPSLQTQTASQAGAPASSSVPQDAQHHTGTDDELSSVNPNSNSNSTNDEEIVTTIDPAVNGAALDLLACVIENCMPDSESEGYYLFGFPACRNDDEIQKLGGLYKAVFTSAQTKIAAVFTEVCHAVMKHQLPQIFDKYGWKSFRRELPYLEGFVTTPVQERATVFRLVQFLRSESDTNPPPVLIRDYGFHLCRTREEVEALKGIYQCTLETLTIFKLHNACMKNKLLEDIQAAGVSLDPKHRRFLRNQGPRPELGYQKNTLGFKFDQGLFKHEKIQRRWMQLG